MDDSKASVIGELEKLHEYIYENVCHGASLLATVAALGILYKEYQKDIEAGNIDRGNLIKRMVEASPQVSEFYYLTLIKKRNHVW